MILIRVAGSEDVKPHIEGQPASIIVIPSCEFWAC